MFKNRWTMMKKMISARSFFCLWGDQWDDICCWRKQLRLVWSQFSLSLGSKKRLWKPVASMRTNMAVYNAAVLEGKLLVTEGCFWPFHLLPRGQIYDPQMDIWENMATELREGWTGSSVVMYGNLFVVTEQERTKVKVYDAEWDSWDVVEGPPLPDQIGRPFCVNCWEHKIYVIGQNLHVAVGHIWRLYPGATPGKKHRFSVQWQIVDAPGGHFDPRPSSAQMIFP